MAWRIKGKVGPRPDAPTIVPKWALCFLAWCVWRRNGRVGPRPSCDPYPVYDWFYPVLKEVNKLLNPPPPPVLSFYTQKNGSELIAPGGQCERGPEMKAAGYDWAQLNVADGALWSDWTTTIESLKSAGVEVSVGGRVANKSVAFLIGEAAVNGVDCILNIEDEFKTTSPAQFETYIKAALDANPTYSGDVVINTVGWLYNDLDYTALAHRPVLLQVYPGDMGFDPAELPTKTDQCISHAKEKGFTDIGVMFQATGDAQPSWYTFWGSKPRSLYTGDIVGARLAWAEWAVPE